jgi:hypothetical protein
VMQETGLTRGALYRYSLLNRNFRGWVSHPAKLTRLVIAAHSMTE